MNILIYRLGRFDSAPKFEPYDHGWSSVSVDNESVYVETYVQQAEHLNWSLITTAGLIIPEDSYNLLMVWCTIRQIVEI
jgi:hypothetical protein